MAERVFVVPRGDLHPEPWPQGFSPLSPAAAAQWRETALAHGFFAPRDQAEVELGWKQPIPYCAIQRGGEVFVVRRLAGGGEQRLHGRLSVGIGGHVGPADMAAGGPGADLFEQALARELAEELVVEGVAATPRLVGLINDDSNPVGRVHVGLAYVLDIAATSLAEPTSPKIEVRETTVLAGGFRPLAGSGHVWQDLQKFESWSQILLEGLWRPWHRSSDEPATRALTQPDGSEVSSWPKGNLTSPLVKRSTTS